MVNEKYCKLEYCIDDCHVMSCRHHCIYSYKNSLKTILSIKNFIKYLAGNFTRMFRAPNGAQFDKFQILLSVIYKF